MKTIKELYDYSSENNIKLLSDYSSTFWNDYKSNYARYDSIFERFFSSFEYLRSKDTDDVSVALTKFANDVYNHLLINDKKYNELYRVNVISDEIYSLTENYDITETMDKDITDDDENTYGEREDSNSSEVDNTNTGKVSPYDSNSFYNDNELHEEGETSGSFTKGQQIDTLNKTYAEDYTMRRHGNIGVQTVTDMLRKHKDFWSMWEFYEYIFKEISNELLIV